MSMRGASKFQILCIQFTTIAALFALGAHLAPSHAQADECSPSIDPIVDIAAPDEFPYFPGDTAQICVTYGVTTSSISNTVIERFLLKLDCPAGDTTCLGCNNPDPKLNYLGVAAGGPCATGGVTPPCGDPGLLDAIVVGNMITISSLGGPILLPPNEHCHQRYDLQVANDATPGSFLRAAACFDARCANGLPTTGLGSVAILVGTCEAEVVKEVSCNGGPWTDSCMSLDGQPVQVRYRVRNASNFGVTIDNCTIVDSNGEVPACPDTGPLPPGFDDVVCTTDAFPCVDGVTDVGEPDEVTLACECRNNAKPPVPAAPVTDTAEFQCAANPCNVQIDKQVSCTSGYTWVDVGFGDGVVGGCVAPEDAHPMFVRYLVQNISEVGIGLENCTITESNAAIHAVPLNIGDLPGNFSGEVWISNAMACFDELDEAEPNTAEIVCDCPGGGQTSDSDSAYFDCLDCDVDVDRQISCDAGVTWNDLGYRDGAVADCATDAAQPIEIRYLVRNRSVKSLVNCVLTDSNTSILPVPVNTGPLVFGFEDVVYETGPLTCGPLAAGEPGTASLSCECVPTCQTNAPMSANYCRPGCPPDVTAADSDSSSLVCN